jgi:hypothetical protein
MNEVNVSGVPHRHPRLVRILVVLSLAVAWQGCEAAGGEAGYSPEECSDACNKVAGANCGDVGESCFDSCVSYPNAPYEGDCQLELKAYLDCWWAAVSYECDAHQRTQPVGCDAERSTYLTCAGDAGAGGAGGASDGAAGGRDAASAGAPDSAGAGAGAGAGKEAEGGAAAGTGGAAGAGD